MVSRTFFFESLKGRAIFALANNPPFSYDQNIAIGMETHPSTLHLLSHYSFKVCEKHSKFAVAVRVVSVVSS